MKHQYGQVEVLIWPGKRIESRSIDYNGHVELLAEGKYYGFFPDDREMALLKRDLVRGCKGMVLSRSQDAVVSWYLSRLKARYKKDVNVLHKNKEISSVWSFAFETSSSKLQRIVEFFEAAEINPPVYAYRANQPNSYNCQTITVKALVHADIFEAETFTSVSPNAFFHFLHQKKESVPNLRDIKELQVIPPGFQ